ncbi:hypothetical protein [Bradyrhizobium sp. JR3.5]
MTAIRLSEDLRAAVDGWAEQQDDAPSRSEAIRRLVEIGLTVPTEPLPDEREEQGREDPKQRARELASKAIDKVTDPAASPDESSQS